MIKIQNSMGDTLAEFETDQEAERFENAVRLIGSYQESRENPASDLAEHPLLRGILGIQEIIDKVSFAVFGNDTQKVSDRAAPFIYFFFRHRSGNLDDEFFYTLAAFTKSEKRKIFNVVRTALGFYDLEKELSDEHSFLDFLFPLKQFHSATPFLQILYIYKKCDALSLLIGETWNDLEPVPDKYKDSIYIRFVKVESMHGFALDLYQSNNVQLCHINEACRVLINDVERELLVYSETCRRIESWEESIDDAIQTALGIPMPIRVTNCWQNSYPSIVSSLYYLSAIFTKIGDGFDEIQWGEMGIKGAVSVIEKVAMKGGPLKAEEIYNRYVLREDVGDSYLEWALPLLLDMWKYQSRPSGDPQSVELTLEFANAVDERRDLLAYILKVAIPEYTDSMQNVEPDRLGIGPLGEILEKSHTPGVYIFQEATDRASQVLLLGLKRILPNNLPTILGYDEDLEAMYRVHFPPSLYTFFETVAYLTDTIPSATPLRQKDAESGVEIIALEKYNPLALFVGHSHVSNCCIYPDSQGEECGIHAFQTSDVDGSKYSKVNYLKAGSHMVLGYSHAYSQFVGGNWAWRPSYIVQKLNFRTMEYVEMDEGVDLTKMYMFDQFELSIWASNIRSISQKEYPQITSFVYGLPGIYEHNPYNFLVFNDGGFTPEIIKLALTDEQYEDSRVYASGSWMVRCIVSPVDWGIYSDFENKDTRNKITCLTIDDDDPIVRAYECKDFGFEEFDPYEPEYETEEDDSWDD